MSSVGKLLIVSSILYGCYVCIPDVPVPRSASPEGPFRPRPPQPASQDHVGGPSWDDRTIKEDLPADQQLKNKVGTDGAGLCVFTSLDHSARWQYVPELIGMRDFMTHYPGGGWPEKVDQMIPKKVAAAGGSMEDVQYIQCTRFDESLLALALKTGRMPAITYGYSPRYGEPISHMVNIVYMDDKWTVFLDNNFPNTYEWVPHAEGIRRINMPDGRSGWFVVLLAPEPPPDPK